MKTIEQIMKEAMSASVSSYYKSKQPLGEEGDFITAPEISQMFGEMIGVWALSAWEKLGKPDAFNLVELGPGRGLLMRDLLRATSKQEAFKQALRISLLDINPLLIKEQRKNLENYSINWINHIEALSALPSIFIANEFFDALPVRQYMKKGGQWREVMVDVLSVIPNGGVITRSDSDVVIQQNNEVYNDNVLDSVASLAMTDALLAYNHPNAEENAILEESPESCEIMLSICRHIKAHQGAALIIDYGYDIAPDERAKDQYNSTLQALKNHKFHPVFENLGEADLSCHVDFYALKNVALKQQLKVIGTITQGNLLKALGIELRLKMLIGQNPDLSKVLQDQHHRLTSKDQMGELFKAIIVESQAKNN